MNKRLRIAVSACLLGEPVRYDGTDKKNADVVALAEQFELEGFCPELGAGLGVPREPIRLVKVDTHIHVRGVNDPHRDVTDALQTCARNYASQAQPICGIILKSRSPSCGLNSTPVYDEQGQQITVGSGAFAAVMQSCFPQLPMIEETDLGDPRKREEFVDRVRAYCANTEQK